MSYLPHLRQTVNGGLPGGERWSCSVSFGIGSGAGPNQEDLTDFNSGALTYWQAWFSSTDRRGGTGTSLTQITTRLIDTTGTTILQAQQGASTPGGNISVSVPNQCAVVISLITATPGARGRGRFYAPCLALTMGTTGRIQTSEVTSIASVTATLLNGLNTSAGINLPSSGAALCVASGVGTGANPRVVAFRVGDVVDTQRRRRDALAETYIRTELA